MTTTTIAEKRIDLRPRRLYPPKPPKLLGHKTMTIGVGILPMSGTAAIVATDTQYTSQFSKHKGKKVFTLPPREHFRVLVAAAGNDAAQSKPLDPDLPIGQPKTDLHFRSGFDRACRFDQAAPHAGVGQIPPDRSLNLVHAQLDGDEALDAGVLAPIAAPAGSEQIGRERGRFRGRSRNRLQGRRWLTRRVTIVGCRSTGFDIAHCREQSFLPFFRRCFAIGLEQFAYMPD